MKPESIHALLIDRELGELPPEAVELLETWLAEHPQCSADVAAIRSTLETTGAAIRRFPELARPEPNVLRFPARVRLFPLAWAASILILLCGAAWLGFRAGQESVQKVALGSHPAPVTAPATQTARNGGPWARYALASDAHGGLTVVRRNPNP